MALCVLAAQVVMIPVALIVGRRADVWGRKPIFIAGFAGLVMFTFLMPETLRCSDEPAGLP